jgi:hypothetical protein
VKLLLGNEENVLPEKLENPDTDDDAGRNVTVAGALVLKVETEEVGLAGFKRAFASRTAFSLR